MVDVESISNRLERLERLIELLAAVRSGGQPEYLADERLRAATERWLQLAEQACIDVGAQLVSELSASPPADYAGIFRSLADAGHLDDDLASRLIAMARQRNLLVHAYLDVDNEIVFESLDHLDDLREFAAAVESLIASGQNGV
ncbi:MAG: type VII toxin-antitoxin system HepT family RNase toxin [Solirubrobacteraceae bacterium]